MSRLGRTPVPVPAGVTVGVQGGVVSVKGPKGSLTWKLPEGIEVPAVAEGKLRIAAKGDRPGLGAMHGLTRALVNNMVIGVSKGYERRLQLVGVGYQAKKEGAALQLQVGFANPVLLPIPPGIEVEVADKGLMVTIRGADKQMVGEFAARARKVRPPEPYKGKGVRYEGEVVRRKAGKTLVSGAGGAK